MWLIHVGQFNKNTKSILPTENQQNEMNVQVLPICLDKNMGLWA